MHGESPIFKIKKKYIKISNIFFLIFRTRVCPRDTTTSHISTEDDSWTTQIEKISTSGC